MSYFSSSFIKQLTPKSTYKYIFSTDHTLDTNEDREQFKNVCVTTILNDNTNVLPDELENPVCFKAVFDQWLLDCSNCFVKPPTFEKFKYSSELVSQPPILNNDTSSNVYYWFPMKIELDMPAFKIYWKVMYYTIRTPTVPDKIQIEEDDVPDLQLEDQTFIQQPDGTRFIQTKDGVRSEWLQELNDSTLPLSDSPALRLQVEYDDAQREKFRRRVREARIRAKLARYRAERLAHRYEERFGDYPDEDAEEAQTEAEQSDEE